MKNKDRRPSRSSSIRVTLEAHVRPTLEVVLVKSPEHLQRKTDEET
jgi:hypothetical protein